MEGYDEVRTGNGWRRHVSDDWMGGMHRWRSGERDRICSGVARFSTSYAMLCCMLCSNLGICR